MIDILIDDDNKVSLKTTNGIAETEIASAIVVEAMRQLKKPEQDVKSKLVLVAYDAKRKLEAVKEVKEKLGLLGMPTSTLFINAYIKGGIVGKKKDRYCFYPYPFSVHSLIKIIGEARSKQNAYNHRFREKNNEKRVAITKEWVGNYINNHPDCWEVVAKALNNSKEYRVQKWQDL